MLPGFVLCPKKKIGVKIAEKSKIKVWDSFYLLKKIKNHRKSVKKNLHRRKKTSILILDNLT